MSEAGSAINERKPGPERRFVATNRNCDYKYSDDTPHGMACSNAEWALSINREPVIDRRLFREVFSFATRCRPYRNGRRSPRNGAHSGTQHDVLGCSKYQPASNRKVGFARRFNHELVEPHAAIMYLALIPQFIHPGSRSVVLQGFVLGTVQISVTVIVNSTIIFAAGAIAAFMKKCPAWIKWQRWLHRRQ